MSEADGGFDATAPRTVLDRGRQRRPVGAQTVLDPRRTRGPRSRGVLPPQLAARFTLGRELNSDEAEAEVYLVTERDTGDTKVLRLYPEAEYRARIAQFLLDHRSPHIVEVFECEVEPGYAYEVMEYLPGGDLREVRDAHPSGLDAERLTELVRQAAGALAELHAAHLVHRDVKPSNLVVRQREPFQVALIDFGISEYREDDPGFTEDLSGTARYMPPEFVSSGTVSAKYDWWSLGMTVLELATGREWLEGLEPRYVKLHLSRGPVRVEEIGDPQIRLLCQGLLTQDFDERWGADEVLRWLEGEHPRVATIQTTIFLSDVLESFTYLDREYRNRTELALELTRTWATAAGLLFRHGREPMRRLTAWARQYPEIDGGLRPGRGPADVRLLRVLRQLAPQLLPIYRGLNPSPRTLVQYARAAANGEGALPEIVEELFDFELLPLLAQGSAMPEFDDGQGHGLDSGDGLKAVDVEWRKRFDRWPATVDTIEDSGARTLLGLNRADAETRRRALAMTLWATVADDAARAEARRRVRAHARTVRLAWFSLLAQDADGMWAAYLLRDYASEQVEAARARREREMLFARHEALLDWLRTHNRPLALAWAVVGISVLSVLCAGMVQVGDLAGRVPVSTITDAWTVTVFSIAAALTAESLLAWETGGRYHPRYSLLGASLIAVGRASRSRAAQRAAFMVSSAVLSAAYGLSVYVPVITPLLVGLAVPLWAVHRLTVWQRDRREERAAIRRGVLAAVGHAGPSDDR